MKLLPISQIQIRCITAGCLLILLASCFPYGNIRSTYVNAQSKATLALGLIENRDTDFNPHTVKNFADLLRMQLLTRNYRLTDPDYSALLKKPVAQPEHTKKPITRGRTETIPENTTRDLLPRAYRYVAGETRPLYPEERITERLLNRNEIAMLKKENDFQFYLQGALGRSETGLMLDVEENTIVILFLYDRSGETIGAVNFTADRRNLSEYEFMHQVSGRLAQEIDTLLIQYFMQK